MMPRRLPWDRIAFVEFLVLIVLVVAACATERACRWNTMAFSAASNSAETAKATANTRARRASSAETIVARAVPGTTRRDLAPASVPALAREVRFKGLLSAPHARTRIRPSWALVAIRRPSRAYMAPSTSPRPLAATGLSLA